MLDEVEQVGEVLLRDLAVVADGKLGCAPFRGQGYGDARRRFGVLAGVVHQGAHEPCEPGAVAFDKDALLDVLVDAHSPVEGDGFELEQLSFHQGGQIDVLRERAGAALPRCGALVHLRQKQQVLYEPLHLKGLVLGALDPLALAFHGLLLMVQQDGVVGQDDCDGGAQVVGNEPLHLKGLVLGALDPLALAFHGLLLMVQQDGVVGQDDCDGGAQVVGSVGDELPLTLPCFLDRAKGPATEQQAHDEDRCQQQQGRPGEHER